MNRSKGRWRLQIVLGTLGGIGYVALMALVLKINGAPYNPRWWWVMAAILVAILMAPRLLAPPLEWIIEGYCGGDAPPDAKRQA
ncbi:MAG TPA: hypothetical protein VMC10_25680 [Stellaceae bacterium]|nr:hypothetical protein [Stellaceae bacterium]